MFKNVASRVIGKIPELERAALAGGDRVVVLGSGWAGFQIAQRSNRDLPLTVISPMNHFLFTPLLPSTAVGTLEFRCIQEPVRSYLGPLGNYVQAKARELDPERKLLKCETVHNDIFELPYDKLVISVGVKTNVSIKVICNDTQNDSHQTFLNALLDATPI
jgi:NADH dehydrogenase FAD-containing subunit